jgi:hypothetical protein
MITPRSRAPSMTSSAARSGLSKIKRSDSSPRNALSWVPSDFYRDRPRALHVTAALRVAGTLHVTAPLHVTGVACRGACAPLCMRQLSHLSHPMRHVRQPEKRRGARPKSERVQILRTKTCCEPGRPLSHLSHLSHPMRHVRQPEKRRGALKSLH